MKESSYEEIMKQLDEEYHGCKFKWDCENCDRTLCLRFGHLLSLESLSEKP